MPHRLLTSAKFSVERHVVTARGAEPHEHDVVVHPGAVVVLPILDDGRMVLIRNHRYAVDEELWELVAGTAEPNEPPIETAGRELEEEAGFRAGRLSPLAQFYTSPGFCTELMHAYVATELEPVPQRLDASERITVEILEVERVWRMLLGGELRDGKSIATLGLYFLRREAAGQEMQIGRGPSA